MEAVRPRAREEPDRLHQVHERCVMKRTNREELQRDENRQLSKALEECRELLKRTEQLLERAQRSGGPMTD